MYCWNNSGDSVNYAVIKKFLSYQKVEKAVKM